MSRCFCRYVTGASMLLWNLSPELDDMSPARKEMEQKLQEISRLNVLIGDMLIESPL